MVMRVRTPEEWGRGSWNAARYPWDDRAPLRGGKSKKKIVDETDQTETMQSEEIHYNPPPVERIDGGNMLGGE